MSDLNFQDISTVQSDKQQKPVTLASAATVAPTTFLTFITGTVAIANVTPPVSGCHMLAFVFTNANPTPFTGAGNVTGTYDPQQNVVTFLVYDPITQKYFVGATV